MRKKNTILTTGFGLIMVSVINWIVAIYTSNDTFQFVGMFVLGFSLLYIAIGLIIQKIDELLDKFSPQTIYDIYADLLMKIELNKKREKQHKQHNHINHYMLGPHAFDKGYTSTYDVEECDLTTTTSSLDGTEDN